MKTDLIFLTIPLLFALMPTLFAQNEDFRYCKSIKPRFYNVSTLTSAEETNLRSWIRWKNKMPRFGFYLNYVFSWENV